MWFWKFSSSLLSSCSFKKECITPTVAIVFFPKTLLIGTFKKWEPINKFHHSLVFFCAKRFENKCSLFPWLWFHWSGSGFFRDFCSDCGFSELLNYQESSKNKLWKVKNYVTLDSIWTSLGLVNGLLRLFRKNSWRDQS